MLQANNVPRPLVQVGEAQLLALQYGEETRFCSVMDSVPR